MRCNIYGATHIISSQSIARIHHIAYVKFRFWSTGILWTRILAYVTGIPNFPAPIVPLKTNTVMNRHNSVTLAFCISFSISRILRPSVPHHQHPLWPCHSIHLYHNFHSFQNSYSTSAIFWLFHLQIQLNMVWEKHKNESAHDVPCYKQFLLRYENKKKRHSKIPYCFFSRFSDLVDGVCTDLFEAEVHRSNPTNGTRSGARAWELLAFTWLCLKLKTSAAPPRLLRASLDSASRPCLWRARKD